VTRTWADFLGDDEAPVAAPAVEESGGWFRRLRDSLSKSRQALTRELGGAFDPNDAESWERIEESLIAADCGVPATVEIVRRLEERAPRSQGELAQGLEDIVADLVDLEGDGKLALGPSPSVVLVVGVNGTGKTSFQTGDMSQGDTFSVDYEDL
jgi:fused signal recognition particle receptor